MINLKKRAPKTHKYKYYLILINRKKFVNPYRDFYFLSQIFIFLHDSTHTSDLVYWMCLWCSIAVSQPLVFCLWPTTACQFVSLQSPHLLNQILVVHCFNCLKCKGSNNGVANNQTSYTYLVYLLYEFDLIQHLAVRNVSKKLLYMYAYMSQWRRNCESSPWSKVCFYLPWIYINVKFG